ncbi:cytochrome b/b6 domain-containing protein [Rahnella perminowiae]|uniref:cytochrome b/b6 domain-containing protein n=1 Tax=Rahnella perminowiae TaxID=2816244 RepID=UPI00215B9896|nr:cytochrome b/b6 domain-containing protein [Rahnella perminowiae]MCR9001278.1 cytochrome b/b6 domain-containing protein [Rahnella perminowiae]
MKSRIWNRLPHEYAPFFRALHIVVALLIFSQIINSNFTETEALTEHGLDAVITWVHVISGFGLIICGFMLLGWMMTRRGFTYYFAWAKLDFSGIKQDINTLMKYRLPESHSGGIASTVQGLGVLALLCVAMSGGLWFLLNAVKSDLADTIIGWHKFLTTFIEVYFYAHGAMGVLHLLIERYKNHSPAING